MMCGKYRVAESLVIGLVVVLCTCRAAAAAPPAAATGTPPAGAMPGACSNQSPRALAGVAWDKRAAESPVENVTDQTVLYHGQTLHLCSQHFHCQIENFQGCAGQSVSPDPGPVSCPVPPAGSWVEVHRAYAAKAGCVGHVGDCCLEEPFVVLGYQAKVAPGIAPVSLPLFRQQPFADFSGSTTGPGHEEGAEACKPAAYWSFSLGCGYTVHANQLTQKPNYGEGARPLQSDVSRDLTLVVAVH